MPDEYLCAGGCGEKTKSPGFKWGHKNGCKPKASATTPRTSLAKVGTVIEIDPPVEEAAEEYVELQLTVTQIDRIWASLPIAEKALGLQTALSAERE